MQAAAIVVLGLLAVAVALALVAGYLLAIIFGVLPLLLIATTVGLLCGACIGLIGTVRGLGGLEDAFGAAVPKPGRRRRRPTPYPVRDDAWPHYLIDQVARDVGSTMVWPAQRVALLWRTVQDLEFWLRRTGGPALLLIPALLAAPVFVAAMAVGAAVMLIATFGVVVPVTLAAWLLGAAAAAVLRMVDYSVRWWRGAAALCPACRWVTALPAYECPACRVRHHDVRPGLLGIRHHVCACGIRMPTMVLRAGTALDPICPRCDTPLPRDAGLLATMRIAVSGAPKSGKTTFVMAGVGTMRDRAAAAGRSWVLEEARSTDGSIHTVTVRTSLRLRELSLHFIDPPGDLYTGSLADDTLHHLGTTRYHLLVVDAVTISAGSRLRAGVVEFPYRMLVEQIRQYGMNPRKCMLAVVLSRMDTLWARSDAQRLGLAGDHPPHPRAWLIRMGHHNLTMAADRDFARVRYFFDGSPPERHFGHAPRQFADSSAPIRWLLRQRRPGMGFP